MLNSTGTLGLHCCSKWFELLPSRVHGRLSGQGCGSGADLVPALWLDDCVGVYWTNGQRLLLEALPVLTIRHHPESRHQGRETLHRRTLRL